VNDNHFVRIPNHTSKPTARWQPPTDARHCNPPAPAHHCTGPPTPDGDVGFRTSISSNPSAPVYKICAREDTATFPKPFSTTTNPS
jgi:hypothetical protein